MKRLTVRLVAAILTFCVGVTAAALWYIHRQQVNANRPITFKSAGVGDVNGFDFNYHEYDSSDGVRVSRMGQSFPSPALATEELEKRAREAEKIIERKPVIGKDGRQVGERVVAVLGKDRASIFGTYEEIFWAIDAPSVKYALALEEFQKS